MRFKYLAKKGSQTKEGVIEANNKFDAYKTLQSQGLTLLKLEPQEGSLNFHFLGNLFVQVKDEDKILFANNLATMISAGLSLSRALHISKKQSNNSRFKQVLESVANDVERGEPFYESLSKHRNIFSDLFISMVKSGELSGNLPSALKSVATQMERTYKLKKKIKGAMIYPSIILLAIFGIGVFMMIVVVPTLAKVFEEMDTELPASTQFIISFSNFLVEHYLISLFILITSLVSIIYFLRTKYGHIFLSKLFLVLPAIGNITRELNVAYAARTMASLLRSGIDIVESTKIASDIVQNYYFKQSLRDVADKISKGKLLSESLREYDKLYPILFIELVSVGEETGVISDMFAKVAEYYEDEVNEKTKNLSTIIEPILMLFIGAAVGFFALAMLSPMYTITQNM